MIHLSRQGDATGYSLQTKATLIAANWDPDAGAQITSVGGTQFRAITTRSGGQRYYRISKP